MSDLDDIYSRQPADDEKGWAWRKNEDGRTCGTGTRGNAEDSLPGYGYSVVWWDPISQHHYPYKAPEVVEPLWRSRTSGGKVYSIPLRPTDVKPEYLDELGLWASDIEGWPHEYRYDFGTKPLDAKNVWVPRAEFLRWKAEQ